MTVIQTHGLTKRYGRVVAVEDLNLSVREGEVYGLLGPNGSGKTTTILMLLGLTEPTSGEARVLGFDPMREPLKVKSRVGYLPDQVGFYGELSAWENLRYTTRLLGLPDKEAEARIEEVLKRMGLWEVRDRKVAAFSRGMRQRLGLAEVLLKRPKVAILDEPTLGLDPVSRREFEGILLELKKEGWGILLTSHDLEVVERVSDRVAFLHRGEVRRQGPTRVLLREWAGEGYRVRLAEPKAEALLQALGPGWSAEGPEVLFFLGPWEALREALGAFPVEVLEVSRGTPSLEALFLHLFGEARPSPSA